jgi:deoxycytidine triphosphate deaminase
MLNRDEITARGLINEGFEERCLKDAGYDLQIDTVISQDEKGISKAHKSSVDLDPQGIVAVISKERVKLPLDVCAYASVKTSLCREGVLAINIGIVDPGWDGPISSLLLNFGRRVHQLRNGDLFLRLTFHSLKHAGSAEPPGRRERGAYETEILSKYDERLSNNFMNLRKAMDDAKAEYVTEFKDLAKKIALKYLPAVALFIALFTGILAGVTFLLNFAVLRSAIPSNAIELRSRALVEDLQRRSELVKRESDELKKEVATQEKLIEDLKSDLDRLKQKK